MSRRRSGGADEPTGVLVIDKPSGLTSHQVVGAVRRALHTRRVGHAGTLDPLATGVLILGIGKATRLLGHLALHDKSYEATIRLGLATTTDDAEGEPLDGAPGTHLTREQIEAAIAPYRGPIMQVPSTVSAIKVDGQRAYARARQGEEVTLHARPVTITSYELGAIEPTGDSLDCQVSVTCSSGTYIRALARDLGRDLGVGGHLTSLRRTRIGRYSLADAIALDDVTPDHLMSMGQAAALSFPVVQVSDEQARDVGYGRSLQLSLEQVSGLVNREGDLLALYQPADYAGEQTQEQAAEAKPGVIGSQRAVPVTVFVTNG